jgi:hypothetical protein
MLNLTNWFTRLNAFLCPSIAGPEAYGDNMRYGGGGASAAQIAKELQRLNAVNMPQVTLNRPVYTPNQYTSAQLTQFNQPQGMQGNPYYQQYLNKMSGMGAGTGKNMPSIAPQPVAASPVAASIAPQPVAASPVAAAGGKNGPII